MAKKPIKDDAEYEVNFEGMTIHTNPVSSESCKTDNAEVRSGVQLRGEEYRDYRFCKNCF